MERFTTTTGIELAYNDGGGGAAIVCLHGLASSAEGEEIWADRLRDSYRVVTFDARGHRRSSPLTDPGDFTFEAMAKDLWELIDHLGIGRTALFGGSMGAGTSLRAALECPERVTTLVQAGPVFTGEPLGFAPVLSTFADLIRKDGLSQAVRLVETALPDTPADLLEDMRTQWTLHSPASLAAMLEGVLTSSPISSLEDLDALQLPVLVIGRDELLHPLDVAKAYAARIVGAELVVSPADEPSLWERPGNLTALIRDFLERHRCAVELP